MVHKGGSGGLVSSIEQVLQHVFGIVSDTCKLFALELQLAGKSLLGIAIMSLLVLFFLIATWFALLAIFIMWLINHMNLMTALLIVIAANLTTALAIVFYIKKLINRLSFKETRSQIASLTRNDHE